jgi:hypothetical protein
MAFFAKAIAVNVISIALMCRFFAKAIFKVQEQPAPFFAKAKTMTL